MTIDDWHPVRGVVLANAGIDQILHNTYFVLLLGFAFAIFAATRVAVQHSAPSRSISSQRVPRT